MEVVRLNWDSDFFNLNIGKMDVVAHEDFKLDKLSVLAKDFDLVYVFCDEDLSGLTKMDRKEFFILDNIKDAIHYKDTEFFSLEKHSYNELLSLTLQSGVYSRFKIDDNFKNNEYEALYTEWINKSIDSETTIDIIIILFDDKIVGFTTLNEKTKQLADIGLVAVDENYRGKGIAKELINRTICRARERGFTKIQVVTQNDNKPARNLYEKAGFKSVKKINVYHYWNYDTI